MLKELLVCQFCSKKTTTASATPRACSNTARCSFPLRSAGGHARDVCHKFDDFI